MTPAVVKQLLQHDDTILIKCLLFLYEQQVEDEKAINQSTHRNKVGFNSNDASILSPIAEAIKHVQTHMPLLMPNNVEKIRSRMLKYATQISRLVDDDFFA